MELLLRQLHRLVDAGNTVVVVEHDLDVIAGADWIIDLGPGAGDEGGTIVATGPPEEVARSERSRTAPYLAERLPTSSAGLVARVTTCASHLEPASDDRWRTAYPFPDVTCEHGCATCKPAMMRALAPAGVSTIFVGAGLSDRHAVAEATTVFAKAALAAHCATEGVVHTRFDSLADVAVGIEEYVRVRV